METAAAVLLFLQGLAPLPEFDELGRPAWLFGETVPRHCPRAGYYEEGVFAHEYGGKECLVELGCWGPVVECNISERGMINNMGGCMNMGGICIGCTMPGFPDKFSPFYANSPGHLVSTTLSRVAGRFIRTLREVTLHDKNQSVRWADLDEIPSGWRRHEATPFGIERTVQKFYNKFQSTKQSYN
jgi:hydrogenase small subunit